MLRSLSLSRHTDRTVTSLSALRGALDEVRRAGVCVTIDEMVARRVRHRGAGLRPLRARGRRLRDRRPTDRVRPRLKMLAGEVKATARALLGAPGSSRGRRPENDREDIMKVGVALNMLQKEGRSDAEVFAEHLALGDLVEPLGFDSLFALEHHFTGYAMSPSPTQLLSYYAGRTKRIALGTAVIVLPWHDPVRVAEQIALLDVMSRRPLPLRLRPRRRERGVRGLPHPHGGGAGALRRVGEDRRRGADPRLVRVGRRVLQDPAHGDPAAARSRTRSGASTRRR